MQSNESQNKGERPPEASRQAPLLPLRDIIIFPYMVQPLFVGRRRSIVALERAMSAGKDIFLAAQKAAKIDEPVPDDIYTVGTLGTINQLLKLPEGQVKVLVEGRKRARIKNYIQTEPCIMVEVEEIEDIADDGIELEELLPRLHQTLETYVKLNKKIPQEMLMFVSSIDNPGRLADTIASHLDLKLRDKQALLEAESPASRIKMLIRLMQSEIDYMEVERRIRSRVKKQMEKTQKEYYLNEQMQAIQKELGERDEGKTEIQEIEEKIRSKKLSKEAHDKVMRELKKFKMMSPMSAEATVVRNYIDWVLSLPWNEYTEDKLDIKEAEAILERDHYGLEKAKQRILEYLAVQSLVDKMKGPILCFVGPPGTGKTSLARSIATATGRKFVRISLGGVRDEAEIRGHRRTYIGALPGKIIQSLRKAGSANPVFLLDEVDKMSVDFRGDPSSALLEVLDPEQNNTFNDHYLDLDFDLSRVMFITTANQIHTIPRPLQDRMEIIQIAGYTEYEKMKIAKRYLVDKQRAANGLTQRNIKFTDNALRRIIREYTREAGVRNLDREIASVCRKVAKEVVQFGRDHEVVVTGKSIPKYLGIPKYRYGVAEKEDQIGVTTGLAWTEVGGELLATEVAIMSGTGKVMITGKLGDVMQESAQAAISYVRSRAKEFGLPEDFNQKIDIHIHVPEGAIPKDGPSAGITMATSIASALMKVPVKCTVAMTGEITLRGRVLPIGGLKEKILAAHRAQIYTVIIPKENEKDLKEIPKEILKKMTIHMVENMDEVLRLALALDDPDEFFEKIRRANEAEAIAKKEADKKEAEASAAH